MTASMQARGGCCSFDDTIRRSNTISTALQRKCFFITTWLILRASIKGHTQLFGKMFQELSSLIFCLESWVVFLVDDVGC